MALLFIVECIVENYFMGTIQFILGQPYCQPLFHFHYPNQCTGHKTLAFTSHTSALTDRHKLSLSSLMQWPHKLHFHFPDQCTDYTIYTFTFITGGLTTQFTLSISLLVLLPNKLHLHFPHQCTGLIHKTFTFLTSELA